MDGHAQLVQQEQERVARTVYLVLRDAGRAEDVTQEAFVRLYLRWGTVSGYDRPGAWVRRVAIRLATREARRERLRSLLERRARPPVEGHGPDADVLRAVGTLGPRQRAAVVLHCFEDLPVAEVAQTLGMSESAVEASLHRARQALAARLDDEPDLSVGDRLREGLERTAAEFVPRTGVGLDAVVTAAHRRRTRRRVATGAVAAVVLGVGAGLVVERGSRAAAPAPVPAASTSTAPTPDRVSSTDADALLATALVGRWVTEVVTQEAATAAMVRTGTASHRDAVLAEVRLPGTFALQLDDLAYRAWRDGALVDNGTWFVRDGRLRLVPSCDRCGIVLAPDLRGGSLRLALLEDPSPDVERVPDAAYATVIYSAAPFRRD